MAETEQNQQDAASSCDSRVAEEVVRSFGVALNNAYLYGISHAVTSQTLGVTHETLLRAQATCGAINITVAEDGLVLNGAAVNQRSPLLRVLANHMRERDIGGFTIVPGLTRARFDALIELLSGRPESIKQGGGFAALLTERGLEGVQTSQLVYRKISEEDVVLSRKDAEKKLAEVTRADAANGEPAKPVNVDTIMAFLKGEGNADAAAQEIQKGALSPEKLADLILHAAEIRRERAAIEGGESFAGLIVGCLRKTFEGLAKDPSAKTQKGKRCLERTLLLLEKQVLEKLSGMAADVDESALALVHDTAAELRDEIEIDALAAEYMKKRQSMEANEKRIVRFLRAKGGDSAQEDDLRQRLTTAGLAPEGWRELLVKSGAPAGESAGGGAGSGSGGGISSLETVGRLALLLTGIERLCLATEASADGVASTGMKQAMAEVNAEVGRIADNAERKISELERQRVRGESEAETWSREKFFAVLSEIGQELCQPLSVIQCSIAIIRNGQAGGLTDMQTEMSDLALASGRRIETLVNRLTAISGMPKTTKPDSSIISALYDEPPAQNARG